MKNNNIIFVVMAALMLVSCTGIGVLLFKDDTPVVNVNTEGQTTDQKTISVSASGEISVVPDVGYIQMGVEVRDADAKTAEQNNAEIMSAVIEAVKEFGLDEKDITTSNYYITPIYEDYAKDSPSTYEVGNTIQIKVRDLGILGDIVDAASAAGANRSNSISFDYEDREQAYNEALANAVENAKNRAETIAEASGYKITGIVSVSESGSYYSPYTSNYMLYSTASYAGDAQATPVSAGDMDITANVNVVFEMAPID